MFRWLKKIFTPKKRDNEELNVINSIANAKRLYKELIVKAHPDKHPNNIELAQSLTEEINNSRYNYNELVKLEKMIKEKLNY